MFVLKGYLIIAVIVTCVALVNGYGRGSPESSCDTMATPHNNPDGAQPDATSYMIMLGSNEVKRNGTVSVHVMSHNVTNYFEGILLKAIEASQALTNFSGTAGSFIIPKADVHLYHYLNCSDKLQSAVTHSSSVNKTDVTFSWKAPNKPGLYVFVASIAQDHDVYWLPFRSDPIKVNGGVAGHANKLIIFVVALAAIIKRL